MVRDIKKLVSEMTLEEKAGLCSGQDFWTTKAIERLGIPSMMMTDGPHGLRKQKATENVDNLGIFNSVPSTCFPSAVGLASTWDRDLIQEVGIALGKECQAEDVAILLGPGVNIKRSPLCGRNFEYFSEDPYLTSELASSHVDGVQSQGVGTSLKHFAANNQEHLRMTSDSIVDERTLREIYFASFENVVKKSQPWTVMCSYNKVNGIYASENKRLLTDILKEEWGHEGFVVSDWGAVNEREAGVAAGLELEMPSSGGVGDQRIIEAVQDGRLSEEALNKAVERYLKVLFKAVDSKQENVTYNQEEHHQLARKVAGELVVLLKNEARTLPLKKEGSIAVIGGFAKKPRFQGGGSSHVTPTKLDEPFEEIQKLATSAKVSFAEGYRLDSNEIDDVLISEAKTVARNADVAVLFVGLPDSFESEGYDRTHLSIPENHEKLIEAVSEVQKNIVVVLSNGSPIEMPWLDRVNAVLEGYLGGQAFGGGVADVLFGEVNPSGKIAETFPMKLSDNPSYLNFPGEGDSVEYKEGIFVGYRYYEKKKMKPLFPFGFGLSYTTFEYTNVTLSSDNIKDTETVDVIISIKNTGPAAGKEIVQVYVSDKSDKVIRPEKELKGFAKVDLHAGEEKTVKITLDKRSFAYYNVALNDWHVQSGEFEVLVGGSSDCIAHVKTIHVDSSMVLRKKAHRNTTLGELMEDPATAAIVQQIMAGMAEQGGLANAMKEEPNDMMLAMMKYLPLRALVNFSGGRFSEEMMEGLLAQINTVQ
ncbi:glycoside hydrolase family 3 C-terminal domain-containing protein [Bacillus sp. FJAT-49711]|uniref:beta-glucosidase family protein n=1 Tax=Bacillus sp. FJAT-49711 TaxID=2833585 RepID=UPI001BC9B012|nr:glycoside hydrolase family 3 C-terminal domain-containing protein [Bacillus sp. FJAT-49711]MBS4219656.1 glycoside hydrolase family 3 C-terminal domain-containing protein [Bacillus sp. FJAT-49711]